MTFVCCDCVHDENQNKSVCGITVKNSMFHD